MHRLAPRLERDIAEALGLPVSIEGVYASLLPRPALEATGVVVENLPGARSPHLLTIGELHVGLRFRRLFERILVVESFELRDTELRIEPGAEGRFELPIDFGSLLEDSDEDDGLELKVRRVAAEDLRVFYLQQHEEGEKDDRIRSLVLDDVELDARGLEGTVALDAKGAFDGAAFELAGELGSLAVLRSGEEPFPLALRGRIFEASIEVAGTVLRPMELEGFDLEVSAELPGLLQTGLPIEDIGPIRAVGRVSDVDGSVGIEAIELRTLRSDPVEVKVSGRIDELPALGGIALDIDAVTSDLDFAERLLRVDVPDAVSAELDLEISDADGTTGLEGKVHAETADGGIRLDASGEYGDLEGVSGLDMNVSASLRDLALVADILTGAPELPSIGPVTASGRLVDQDGRLGLRDIRAVMGSRDRVWVEAEGSIRDLLARAGLELSLRFGAVNIQYIAELFGREVAVSGSVEGDALLSDVDGTLGFEQIQLRGREGDDVEIEIAAVIDDLRARDEIELDVKIRTPSLTDLGALVDRDLPALGPVVFEGRLSGSDEDFVAERMVLRLGQTTLRGRVEGSALPGERPALRAQLESSHIRLADLGVTPEGEAPSRARSWREARDYRVPFEVLRELELDLELRADRVTGRKELDLSDVHASVSLHDGDLLIGNAGTRYKEGQIEAELRADARQPLPEVDVFFDARGVDLARLMAQFETDSEYEGLIDARLDLKTSGQTQEQLRRRLAGEVVLVLRDGTAASAFSRKFVVSMADVVFPGFRRESTPRIGCAIGDFEIRGGIANVNQLLLDGGPVTVTGSGTVDLVYETFDLLLVPSTREPGIVSVAPEVTVSGPLDDPQFRPRKRTLATSLGRGLITNVARLGRAIVSPVIPRDKQVQDASARCAQVGIGQETAAR